jgi:hypothetical protein
MASPVAPLSSCGTLQYFTFLSKDFILPAQPFQLGRHVFAGSNANYLPWLARGLKLFAR